MAGLSELRTSMFMLCVTSFLAVTGATGGWAMVQIYGIHADVASISANVEAIKFYNQQMNDRIHVVEDRVHALEEKR